VVVGCAAVLQARAVFGGRVAEARGCGGRGRALRWKVSVVEAVAATGMLGGRWRMSARQREAHGGEAGTRAGQCAPRLVPPRPRSAAPSVQLHRWSAASRCVARMALSPYGLARARM